VRDSCCALAGRLSMRDVPVGLKAERQGDARRSTGRSCRRAAGCYKAADRGLCERRRAVRVVQGQETSCCGACCHQERASCWQCLVEKGATIQHQHAMTGKSMSGIIRHLATECECVIWSLGRCCELVIMALSVPRGKV
jgi:hypothetical protein